MDQIKTGSLLRDLRLEKALTQEQLAEKFNVSRRTVSRWETGSNLPDIDILIEMADFYGLELREILDGERKSDNMNKETEETVIKVAQLSSEENLKVNRRMNLVFIAGTVAAVIFAVLFLSDRADNFFGGLSLGFTAGMPILGVIMTGKNAAKLRELKLRLLRRGH